MKKARLFALAALVLVMLLAACGGGQAAATQPAAGTQPTAAPTTAVETSQEATEVVPAAETAPTAETVPTTEVVPTEAVATTAAEEDLSLDSITAGLDQLQSYKSSYSIRFVGKDTQGQAVDNQWQMAEEFILEPRAQRIASTVSKSAGGQVTESAQTEMITIGQTSYIVNQEAGGTRNCVSVSSSDATPPEQSLSPDMWGGVSDAKYVNTETVNGIRAKHYAWKEGSLVGFGWASGKGETWVAVDGGFVVKQVMEGTGKAFLLGEATDEGTTTVEYEVTDVNGSFEIAPPQGCESAASDIPVMLDALDRMTFGDSLSYRSPSAFADIQSFYQTEMPAEGWQVSGDPVQMEGFAQLTYTKDTRTASIMLSLDTSTSDTTVVIQVTKE